MNERRPGKDLGGLAEIGSRPVPGCVVTVWRERSTAVCGESFRLEPGVVKTERRIQVPQLFSELPGVERDRARLAGLRRSEKGSTLT